MGLFYTIFCTIHLNALSFGIFKRLQFGQDNPIYVKDIKGKKKSNIILSNNNDL